MISWLYSTSRIFQSSCTAYRICLSTLVYIYYIKLLGKSQCPSRYFTILGYCQVIAVSFFLTWFIQYHKATPNTVSNFMNFNILPLLINENHCIHYKVRKKRMSPKDGKTAVAHCLISEA